MNWEDIKKIAAARFNDRDPDFFEVYSTHTDEEFHKMILKNWDRIAAVVDAAIRLRDHWANEDAHFACGGAFASSPEFAAVLKDIQFGVIARKALEDT